MYAVDFGAWPTTRGVQERGESPSGGGVDERFGYGIGIRPRRGLNFRAMNRKGFLCCWRKRAVERVKWRCCSGGVRPGKCRSCISNVLSGFHSKSLFSSKFIGPAPVSNISRHRIWTIKSSVGAQLGKQANSARRFEFTFRPDIVDTLRGRHRSIGELRAYRNTEKMIFLARHARPLALRCCIFH